MIYAVERKGKYLYPPILDWKRSNINQHKVIDISVLFDDYQQKYNLTSIVFFTEENKKSIRNTMIVM